jgi:2-oxoglutarate dehydrogenase E1 component
VRIEQFYPLREDLLKQALEPFGKAKKFAWVQEEPANMGAWSFLRPHLAKAMGRDPLYVGRDVAAAPAVGSHRLHKEEQERIVAEAFSL